MQYDIRDATCCLVMQLAAPEYICFSERELTLEQR